MLELVDYAIIYLGVGLICIGIVLFTLYYMQVFRKELRVDMQNEVVMVKKEFAEINREANRFVTRMQRAMNDIGAITEKTTGGDGGFMSLLSKAPDLLKVWEMIKNPPNLEEALAAAIPGDDGPLDGD